MKINNLMINGVEDFIGYSVKNGLKCSWYVSDSHSKTMVHGKIEISAEPEFRTLLFCRENENLDNRGEMLDFETIPRKVYFLRLTITGSAGDVCEETICFETGKIDEPWEVALITQ